MKARLLPLLVPLACSPSAPPGDYASGTRLRAQIYVAASGAKQFHGLFDAERGEPCELGSAEDGLTRCLPTNVNLVPASDVNAFVDASCTQPALVAAMAPSAKYFGVVDGCRTEIYQVGAPATAIYTLTNGTCSSYPGDPTYFAQGVHVDPSSFVAGTLVREPRGSQLAMQTWQGTDGTRAPLHAFDVARHGSCATLSTLEDRCAPLHVDLAATNVFSDPSCSSPVAAARATGDCDPWANTWFPPDDPVTAVAVLAPDPAHPSCHSAYLTSFAELDTNPLTSIYLGSNTGCAPPADGVTFWPVGADIPTSSLPTILHAHASGGRLVERVQTAVTGERLFVEGFFDTQLAAACYAAVADDGVLRCLPFVTPPRYYDVAYTDPQCTTPILVETDGGCSLFEVGSLLPVPNDSTHTHVVLTGALIAAPTKLYTPIDGQCSATTLGPSSELTYYAINILPPETFATLSDVTE